MNKTVETEIKQILKQMQDNRQRWRLETKKEVAEDESLKLLKRMRFKKHLLTENENATADDWDALANEYESLGFLANSASCGRRADHLRNRNRVK
jgi:hypothetical protein